MATIEERLKAIEEKLGIEQKPVAGWYKSSDKDHEWWLAFSDGEKYKYGFVYENCFKEKLFSDLEDSDYLADPKEVEQRLIEEAKRRGFKEGVKFNLITNQSIVRRGLVMPLVFDSENNELTDENDQGWTIYRDGKWAEIIEEPLTLNGKEVYFDNKYVWLGNESIGRCSTVMQRRQLKVYVENAHIKSITFNQDETYSSQDLKQLLTKIQERESKTT